MKKGSKKGSLELGINAIVILIMAMALLGVGIYFITTILTDSIDVEDLTDGAKDQILTQLRESGGKFLMSGVGEDGVMIERGKDTTITLTVMNDQDSSIKVRYKVELIKDAQTPLDVSVNYNDVKDTTLKPGESNFERVKFSSETLRGTQIWAATIYYCTITTGDTCTIGSEEYVSQTFFVTVK